MPNMGQTITYQVIKNHIPLSQTQTTGRENQWQPRKEKSLGGEPHPFGLYGHATANTIKLTRTNAQTHTHTHTHTHATHTHTHTHTLLQSYPCWSKACRLSDVKVMNGWLFYRRCNFYAGFTSCTKPGKRNR